MYKTSPHVISFHGDNYDKIIIRSIIHFILLLQGLFPASKEGDLFVEIFVEKEEGDR